MIEQSKKSRQLSPLAVIRRSRGLRQLDVAILTGLSPTTIFHIEAGANVSNRTRKKVRRVLGLPEDHLFGCAPPGA